MCLDSFSSPAVLHSKNYEDYQNNVNMQENDGHCNAEFVDGEITQGQSNLKESDQQKKREFFEDEIEKEWESIKSFDDNWLTVLEQEGFSSYFPADYVKANNVKSWLEFVIPEEPENRKKIKYCIKHCKTDFHNAQISMIYTGPMSEGGRVMEDKS